MIPSTLFEDELLKFSVEQKQALLDGGLQAVDIPGTGVLRAQEVIRTKPGLSVHDGFAFALAESHDGCILVTGDGELRTLAAKHGIEVHGLLWIVEQIHKQGAQPARDLAVALRILEQDQTVRLPRRELTIAIRRYEG